MTLSTQPIRRFRVTSPTARWLARAIPLAIIVACADSIVGPRPTIAPPAFDLSRGGGVVISQVYGGGGNGTGSSTSPFATYRNDYVELYNAGPSPVDVTNWTIQYASATGTSWQKTTLSGTIQPGRYYLVQQASGGTAGVLLPTPDLAGGTINLSATSGKVALVNSTVTLTGSGCPFAATVIDFVGYGTADCREGAGAAPGGSNVLASLRAGDGATDTNDNSRDFSAGTPNPRNASSGGAPPIGPLDHVAITGGASTLAQGSTIQFTATGLDASNQTVPGQTASWTSSASTVATVDNTGKVTGVSANDTPVTLTATVTAGGITRTATTSVTVTAPPSSGYLVISQVYGGGGNSGATLTNDFIELYNPTDATISLAGWSVQYASATNTLFTDKTDLSGSIAPGRYFLIQQAKGSGGTQALPAPDVVGSIAMGATGGKVALVRSTTLLATGCPLTNPAVSDFVGYGAADCGEGGHPVPALSNTTAALRNDGGRQDADDNAADFTVAAPAPRNSSTPALPPLSALSVKIAPSQPSVQTGATVAFTAAATKDKQAVAITSASWTSASGAVATIDPNTGVATAVGIGTTTIGVTVTTAVGTATSTTTLTVAGAVAAVTVSPSPVSLKLGSTRALTASAVDAAGNPVSTTFTWSSSSDAVASVDASGVVTGKALGDAVISATSANGRVGTVSVSVISPANVTVTSGKTSLALAMQTQFFFGGTDASGAPVTSVVWSTSDPSVITVDQKGVVTAAGLGGAVLRATAPDGSVGSVSITTYRAAGPVSPVRLGHNTEFGVPTDGDPSDDILIVRDQYTVSYNPRLGGANWVSWNLDRTHIGSNGRCPGTCYSADTALSRRGITAYTTADWVSRTPTDPGYDRGHMAPSADWTSSEADNNTTFFLSNFLPQRHDMNAGPWERLESALRDSVSGGREAYIIAGGIFANGVGLGTLLDKGQIGIPNSTYKIAVITPPGTGLEADGTLPPNSTVLAVNMPNVIGILGDGFEKYLTTVAALERATGYDFLALLAERVQCRVEARNCAPTARITGGAATASEGQTLTFDGSTSSDPDAGDAVAGWQWSVNGVPAASAAQFSYTFPDNGTYRVRLVATDRLGAVDSAVVTVVVSNEAPVITSVASTSTPERATLTAAFTDAGVADAPWSYTIDWGDGSAVSTATVGTQGMTIAADHYYERPGAYTASAVVRDKDGAVSAPASTRVVVKDRTPPEITYAVTGTEGLNGWYTSDVTVRWTIRDPESEVTSAPCADVLLTANTTGSTVTCSATSEGGTATRAVTVKRDATPPVVTGVPSGSLGAGGWYTGNVTVTWSAADEGAPVSATPCEADILIRDSEGTTFTCSATNEAGLVGSATVTVKKDASTPTIDAIVRGTAGLNGWYTSDVALSWVIGGVGPSGSTAAASCAPQTLRADFAPTVFECAVTTGAGVRAAGSTTVKRDATPPTLTPTVTGPLGENGWYRGDVTVSWSARDGTSPVTPVPCPTSTVVTDGTSSHTCTATNEAGLSTTVQQTVKRDATPPVIEYRGNAGDYTVDQSVVIRCTATDVTSTLAFNGCRDVIGDAYTFGVGTTTFSATAIDVAGLTSSARGTFTVRATPTSLCALVERWTSNAGVAQSLCTKLAKGHYEPFRNEVTAQSGKKIDADKAAVLLRLVDAL